MSGSAAWADIDCTYRCPELQLECTAAVSVQCAARQHLLVGTDAEQHGSVGNGFSQSAAVTELRLQLEQPAQGVSRCRRLRATSATLFQPRQARILFQAEVADYGKLTQDAGISAFLAMHDLPSGRCIDFGVKRSEDLEPI